MNLILPNLRKEVGGKSELFVERAELCFFFSVPYTEMQIENLTLRFMASSFDISANSGWGNNELYAFKQKLKQ